MVKENKKVINASSNTIDNINFKSLLEGRFYKYLKENNYNFVYELEKIVLQESFRPKALFFKKYKRSLKLDKTIVRQITYTPDFILYLNDYTIYIEAKGFKTDSYNIKVKLFRKWIDNKEKAIFAELKTLTELKQLIEYVQQL